MSGLNFSEITKIVKNSTKFHVKGLDLDFTNFYIAETLDIRVFYLDMNFRVDRSVGCT